MPFSSPGKLHKKQRSETVKQAIVHIALVVRDYDEAIEFYTNKLHFTLVEDTYQPQQDKRWVVVSPPGSNATTILLAKASKPRQEAFIGDQAGGRVFLFLATDDFKRDYRDMKKNVCNVNRQYCSCTYTRGCIFLLYAVFADEIGYR